MATKDQRIEILVKENEELREENFELRKFVNYVRSLKTEEDFINLKNVLESANFILERWEKWEDE